MKQERTHIGDLLRLMWKSICLSIIYYILVQAVKLLIIDRLGDSADGLLKGTLESLWSNITIILIMVVVSVFFLPLVSYMDSKALLWASNNHDASIYNKFLHQKMSSLDQHEAGDLLYRIEMDPIHYRTSFLLIINKTMALGFLLIFSLYILLGIHRPYTGLCIVLSLLTAILPMVIRPLMRSNLQMEKFHESRVRQVEEKSLMSIGTIKAHGLTTSLMTQYKKGLNQLYEHALRKKLYVKTGLESANEIISLSSDGVIYLYGAYLVSKNTITPGELIKFMGIAFILKKQFKSISSLVKQSLIYKVTNNRLDQLIGSPEENLGQALTDLDEIEFKQVSFAYESGKRVLDNLSMTLEKGRLYSLIGPNGSGKSTISKLLRGLYDHEQGQILINGLPIQEFSKKSLRQEIVVVTQSPFVFEGSIEANILLGLETYNMALYLELLDRFDLHQDRYKEVYDQGSNLSGGQRQKISLCRGLLRRPSLLILDEPTSFLDQAAIGYIKNYLYANDITCLVISHDPLLVKDAHVTYSLD